LVQKVAEAAALGDRERAGGYIRAYGKALVWMGFFIFSAVCAASPWLVRFLKLQSPVPVVMAGLLSWAGLLIIAFHAPLQGLLRFKGYSAILVVDPVFRILIGGVLVWAGMGVGGAMIGYLAGYAAAVILGLWLVRDLLPAAPGCRGPRAQLWDREMRNGWFYSVIATLTLSVDVLMVKHYFPVYEAGLYTAVSTLAKMMFLMIRPLGTVAFGMMCRETEVRQMDGTLFWKSIVLTAAVCAGVAATVFGFAPWIIRITYGEQFRGAAALLPWTCVAFFPLALNSSISLYYMARRQYAFKWGFALGTLLQIFWMMMSHGSLLAVVLAYTGGGLAQCLLMLVFGAGQERLMKPASRFARASGAEREILDGQ